MGQKDNLLTDPHTNKRIFIFRADALNYSETFIKEQVLALRGWQPIFLSLRRVDGLAKQGFVTREASSCDRRSMYAVLTAEGLAKLEAAAPTHVQAVRRSLIDHLTPDEVRTLGDVLDHARASRAGVATDA